MEEERRRQEQDRMRSKMQYDTYASSFGGLGMAGADVPRGESGGYERAKRERSVEEEEQRDDDGKRSRGDGDEE